MKITPKFIQRDCVEGDKIDPRQATAVLKYRPDIILFELPEGKNGPDTIFNKYPCEKKPIKKVSEIIKKLNGAAKKYPYAKSDVFVWENIKKLWADGVNTQIYNIDVSDELRRQNSLFEIDGYPACRKDPVFWAYLFVRDFHMARNIQEILARYSEKENPVVAVFLQSIHWKHAVFLLGKPSKKEIWKYYFGRFSKLTPETFLGLVSKRSKVLARYWCMASGKVRP